MFYTYSIKNLETGKVYIGSRTRKVMLNRKPEDDLGVKYFSSSKDKELRKAINDGKVSYRVIKEYSDAKECVRDENELIRLFWLFFGKENSYNHSYSKCNGEKVWSTVGVEYSEEYKQKISKLQIIAQNRAEVKEKKSKSNRISSIKLWKDPKCREKIIKAMRGANKNQEVKKKRSKAQIKKWSDPNYREKIYEINNSLEEKERRSKAAINCWKNPDYRKKFSESKRGKSLKKFHWKTPSGEVEIMDKSHATRYHPDWVCLGPVE